jgi:hypothetical protein
MNRKIAFTLLTAVISITAVNAQVGTPTATGTPTADYVPGGKKLSRAQRFDRGLAFDTRTPSMPRGMWVAGLGGSYSQHDNNNYGVLILDALNSRGNTLTLSPMVHYVFANNQSIGVRFSYRHTLFDMDEARFNITPELEEMLVGTDGNLRYRYESDNFMGFVSYRYYVGLGNSKRFLIFNEVQAGVGGGSALEDAGRTDAGNYKRSTWQRSLNVKLGFSPGATVFVTNHMAVELQIGLLGYEYQRLTQEHSVVATTPGEIGTPPVDGSRATHNVSAKFDLLSIAFGGTFYF